jgi:hypothetical protein
VIGYDQIGAARTPRRSSTSAPITLGVVLPAGTYTCGPSHRRGVDLIVNRQTGRWGTNTAGPGTWEGTHAVRQPGHASGQFTISIEPSDAKRGTLAMAWGRFAGRRRSWCSEADVVLSRRLRSSSGCDERRRCACSSLCLVLTSCGPARAKAHRSWRPKQSWKVRSQPYVRRHGRT